MKFEWPTVKGHILKRYKRFLADIVLDSGEVITAHVPNTGSMKSCWDENWPVILTYRNSPNRKLKYTLEMLHNGKTWIGVNTSRTNDIAEEAFKLKKIEEFKNYTEIKREIKVGKSRIDFLLKTHLRNDCYVEVKNVTLKEVGKKAIFPDAVSSRGSKHLDELISLKEQGNDCTMLYIIQREDIDHFEPAREIDPVYAEKLSEAQKKDVLILVYGCNLKENEIKLNHKIAYKIG